MGADEVNDETLMAYVDGELTPEVAESVEMAMKADAGNLQRAVGYIRSRRLARSAAVAEGLPSVPAAVAATFAGARGPARRPFGAGRFALAACLLAGFVAGGVAADLAARTGRGDTLMQGVDSAGLARVIAKESTGGSAAIENGEARVVGSHRLANGTLCRELALTQESRRTDVLACRDAKEWRLRLAFAPPPAQGGSYRPAGEGSPIDTYLRSAGADAPLSRDDEAAALAQ